ncbi:hypothetical protein [Roseateles sp.]|uniref:hypothetical protein n=1 Tax=Roseateles sp. TaxID=1971397 RepID=UPI0031D74769
MSSRILPAIALASCLGTAIATGVAVAATAPPPEPTDARLSTKAPRPTPPAAASSAAVADPGVGNWRAANRAVHEAGGWRQLMRDRPMAAMPAASTASAPSGHHHH